jgi:hypothetical protein
MAILAESLVEEWLNREGFFTVRGVKHGVGEIDLLAIRHEPGAHRLACRGASQLPPSSLRCETHWRDGASLEQGPH